MEQRGPDGADSRFVSRQSQRRAATSGPGRGIGRSCAARLLTASAPVTPPPAPFAAPPAPVTPPPAPVTAPPAPVTAPPAPVTAPPAPVTAPPAAAATPRLPLFTALPAASRHRSRAGRRLPPFISGGRRLFLSLPASRPRRRLFLPHGVNVCASTH